MDKATPSRDAGSRPLRRRPARGDRAAMSAARGVSEATEPDSVRTWRWVGLAPQREAHMSPNAPCHQDCQDCLLSRVGPPHEIADRCSTCAAAIAHVGTERAEGVRSTSSGRNLVVEGLSWQLPSRRVGCSWPALLRSPEGGHRCRSASMMDAGDEVRRDDPPAGAPVTAGRWESRLKLTISSIRTYLRRVGRKTLVFHSDRRACLT